MSDKKIKVLVTGGAGFIGSHLVERLLSMDCEIVILDNFLRGNKIPNDTLNKIEVINGDVRDDETVKHAVEGCVQIYHLAAYLGVDIVAENPVEAMETEVIGFRNIANSAILHGIEKIIYVSTSGVYGKTSINMAVDEEFNTSPNSSYAIAKRYNEIYLQSLYFEKKLQSCSLRYFNVYGPRQDQRMVIPRFFESALSDEPLRVFGTGEQTRDFTYIDETIDATILAAEKVNGCEILNVARGAECSIYEVAQKIVKLVGSQSEIKLVTPPTGRNDFEVLRRCGNADKLEKLTGFRPSHALDDGLLQTYDYIKESGNSTLIDHKLVKNLN